MRTITPDELKEILRKHLLWWKGEDGGARANLTGANLTDANLTDANLTGAYLAGAYLARADLTGAYLARADLTDAYLTGADLARAYLTGADLARANLTGADLARANLADANLTGAYLAGANLAGAYLTGAYLTGADLARANLTGADLTDADLAGARNVPGGLDTSEPRQPPSAATLAARAERAARYRERHPEVPVVESLDAKILEAVTAKGSLNMQEWHTCEMTHCRGGWAITLAGEAGAKLEKQYGVEHAAVMIYRASTGRVPNFYATNAAAMEDIRLSAGQPTE